GLNGFKIGKQLVGPEMAERSDLGFASAVRDLAQRQAFRGTIARSYRVPVVGDCAVRSLPPLVTGFLELFVNHGSFLLRRFHRQWRRRRQETRSRRGGQRNIQRRADRSCSPT